MQPEPELDRPNPPASSTDAVAGFWSRVQEHKIIQWGLGYLGAALALAHGQELVAHSFHWPDTVGRIFMIVLIAGFPIAADHEPDPGFASLMSFKANRTNDPVLKQPEFVEVLARIRGD